jgi:hypothetical protein
VATCHDQFPAGRAARTLKLWEAAPVSAPQNASYVKLVAPEVKVTRRMTSRYGFPAPLL